MLFEPVGVRDPLHASRTTTNPHGHQHTPHPKPTPTATGDNMTTRPIQCLPLEPPAPHPHPLRPPPPRPPGSASWTPTSTPRRPTPPPPCCPRRRWTSCASCRWACWPSSPSSRRWRAGRGTCPQRCARGARDAHRTPKSDWHFQCMHPLCRTLSPARLVHVRCRSGLVSPQRDAALLRTSIGVPYSHTSVCLSPSSYTQLQPSPAVAPFVLARAPTLYPIPFTPTALLPAATPLQLQTADTCCATRVFSPAATSRACWAATCCGPPPASSTSRWCPRPTACCSSTASTCCGPPSCPS